MALEGSFNTALVALRSGPLPPPPPGARDEAYVW